MPNSGERGNVPSATVAHAGGSEPAPAPAPRGNVRGILAMTAAMGCFSCGDTLMKIAAGTLPTGELIFIRGGLITVMVLAAIVASGLAHHLWRALVPAVAVRAAGDIGGAFFFQSALARMPLADLMAITQLNPLAITAASAVFFKEPVGWRRWTAAAVGLLGVLLIIRPGTSAFTWWALAGLAAVLSSTVRDLATRRVDPSIPTMIILVFSSFATAAWGACLSLVESWQWPSPRMMMLLFAASVFSMVGQASIIVAMRSGELSVVAPFRYSLILFGISLGFIVWGQLPDALGFTGMAIVVLAGLYTFHREQVRKRDVARSTI